MDKVNITEPLEIMSQLKEMEKEGLAVVPEDQTATIRLYSHGEYVTDEERAFAMNVTFVTGRVATIEVDPSRVKSTDTTVHHDQQVQHVPSDPVEQREATGVSDIEPEYVPEKNNAWLWFIIAAIIFSLLFAFFFPAYFI